MKILSKKQIKDYISNDMPLQSCGAYCYEKKGQELLHCGVPSKRKYSGTAHGASNENYKTLAVIQ